VSNLNGGLKIAIFVNIFVTKN